MKTENTGHFKGSEDRRILIVDDEVDFIISLVDILESKGYTVETAHSLKEVKKKIQDFDAHVALLDIRLDRSNGIHIISILKAEYPRILCVMMTAYADTDTAIQALKEGAYDYLRKPLEPRYLLATLNRCFERIRLESDKFIAEEALKKRNMELVEVNARLKMMVKSAKVVTSCHSRNELNKLLLKEFSQNMDADGGSLFICHEDRLELAHSLDPDHVPSTIYLPLSEDSILCNILRKRKPILIEDIKSMDKRLIKGSGWKGYNDNSLLVFPLINERGKIIGLISLHNKRWPPFTAQDLELGSILVSLSTEVIRGLQATESLQESELRFRTLVENIPGVIYRCEMDYNWTMRYISDMIENISGYPASDFVDNHVRSFSSIIHPDDRGMVSDVVHKAVKLRTSFSLEHRIIDSNGSIKWIFERGNGIFAEDGKVKFLDGAVFDITDRKRAELALSESENKFRRLSQEFHTLLDAINEPLILLSPELKILWANRGAETVFGKSASDINGQLCYKLWFNNSTPCEGCPSLKCFSTGEVGSTQFSTSDNRLWDVKVFPVKREKNKISNVIIIAGDITEEKAMQEESMRATQLAALGELAAGVAHEVNNPIYGITMCANLLLEESRCGNIKDYDMVKMILKETDRVANVTRCLLSFVRDAGDDKSLCNINEIMSDTITITGAIMQKEGIDLKIQIPKELPEVIAYPQRLQQVFLNILYNARYALNEKYPDTHKNKIIEITGKRTIINDCPYTQVIFYDHGKGIPADKIDKVLNPFFTTKPSGKGTGLGLSISNKIIKDHNGKLEIDSTEGKFTKVVISLPSTENSH
jgi:PAS domain S-box-containing protein